MEVPNYPLYCYWGGEIVHKDSDITYRGGNQKFVFVHSAMTYSQVLNKLYEELSVDPRGVELKVVMRYPMAGAYVAIPLNDDNAVRAMWIAVTQSSSVAMQLFIEQVPKEPVVQTNTGSFPGMDFFGSVDQPFSTGVQSVGIGSFTRMLVDPHYVNDHLSQFRSPASSPNVGTSTSTQPQGILDSLDPNNVDVFGDAEMNDTDEDDDEEVIEARDKAIKGSAPTSDFNEVAQVDPRLNNSWMSWLGNETYNNGGEFEVGQQFDSLQQLKDAVKSYSIARNQTIRVVEAEPEKYVVECKRKEQCSCSWRLRGVKDPTLSTFKIVRYNGPHASNCVGDIDSGDHKLLTSEFVCNALLDVIRVDPSLKIKTMVQLVKEKFDGFQITYKRAWLAKQKAIKLIYGDWEGSYEQLPKYMQALKESNPGTVVEWRLLECTVPGTHVFQRVFWAFKPCIDGFRHCRPLITIDGTHLYGKYKGTLLIAMGTDANFQLFPLAFAVVEGENNDSWSWFMACIRARVTDRKGLCVISDRHAGILAAMEEVGSGWEEPNAYHKYCTRHLASNVNSKFKSVVIKNLFGKAATARQKKKFDYYINKIGDLNVEARRYLMEIPYSKWSIHHDGGFRFGVKTTNMSEVFNGVLKGARCLPITALVQMTFFRVNSYFATRRSWSKRRLEEGHELSEKAKKTIEANMEKAAHHEVVAFDYDAIGLYQVRTGRGRRKAGKGGNSHTVNLLSKTCTCEKLRIYKLPCSHVLAVCRHRSLSHADFVDSFFMTAEYRRSYAKCFAPVPDPCHWSAYNGPTTIANPDLKRGPGRRSTRIRNEMDERPNRVKKACSVCRRPGHNKKTCPTLIGGFGSSG